MEISAAGEAACRRRLQGSELAVSGSDVPTADDEIKCRREAVGRRIRVMVNQQIWDISQAWRRDGRYRIGDSLAADPIDHQGVAGLSRPREAAARSDGEPVSTFTLSRFAELLPPARCRIGIIDLAKIGGITPWRLVASLAHASNVRVCGHVLPELHVHLLAWYRTVIWSNTWPRSETILTAMPKPEDGNLVAPTAPRKSACRWIGGGAPLPNRSRTNRPILKALKQGVPAQPGLIDWS